MRAHAGRRSGGQACRSGQKAQASLLQRLMGTAPTVTLRVKVLMRSTALLKLLPLPELQLGCRLAPMHRSIRALGRSRLPPPRSPGRARSPRLPPWAGLRSPRSRSHAAPPASPLRSQTSAQTASGSSGGLRHWWKAPSQTGHLRPRLRPHQRRNQGHSPSRGYHRPPLPLTSAFQPPPARQPHPPSQTMDSQVVTSRSRHAIGFRSSPQRRRHSPCTGSALPSRSWWSASWPPR